jgi:hypothetical protein
MLSMTDSENCTYLSILRQQHGPSSDLLLWIENQSTRFREREMDSEQFAHENWLKRSQSGQPNNRAVWPCLKLGACQQCYDPSIASMKSVYKPMRNESIRYKTGKMLKNSADTRHSMSVIGTLKKLDILYVRFETDWHNANLSVDWSSTFQPKQRHSFICEFTVRIESNSEWIVKLKTFFQATAGLSKSLGSTTNSRPWKWTKRVDVPELWLRATILVQWPRWDQWSCRIASRMVKERHLLRAGLIWIIWSSRWYRARSSNARMGDTYR